jgi:hypothetical protein
MDEIKKIVLIWIPFAVCIVCLCALMYLLVQQDIRQSANDPQIQLAEDVSGALNSGYTPSALGISGSVDISKSLATYINIYNSKGQPIAGNGFLGKGLATLPSGVTSYVTHNGEDRFTYQPASGVRSAVVVAKYANGFVLAGRSIKEIEDRETLILHDTELGGIVTLALTLLSIAIVVKLKKPTTSA